MVKNSKFGVGTGIIVFSMFDLQKVLKIQVPSLYPKMPLEVTFFVNSP